MSEHLPVVHIEISAVCAVITVRGGSLDCTLRAHAHGHPSGLASPGPPSQRTRNIDAFVALDPRRRGPSVAKPRATRGGRLILRREPAGRSPGVSAHLQQASSVCLTAIGHLAAATATGRSACVSSLGLSMAKGLSRPGRSWSCGPIRTGTGAAPFISPAFRASQRRWLRRFGPHRAEVQRPRPGERSRDARAVARRERQPSRERVGLAAYELLPGIVEDDALRGRGTGH